MQNLLSSDFDIKDDGDKYTIERFQAIPQAYLDSLKEARFDSKNRRAGEYHRAASIPQALVDHWLAQGYDVFQEPIGKTLAKLKAEGFDAFITTDKQL